MPKQIATPERRTVAFRVPLETDAMLRRAAHAKRETVNDVVISVFNGTLPLWIEGVPEDMREIMVTASVSAAASLRALERTLKTRKRELSASARAILMRELLTRTIRNAINRLLAPSLSDSTALSHWVFAQADLDDLGLEGPVWDFVRSIGPTSPPPTKEQVREISDAIGVLKENAKTEDQASRLETLNIFLGIAQGEHELEWMEVRRAEEEVRRLLTSQGD